MFESKPIKPAFKPKKERVFKEPTKTHRFSARGRTPSQAEDMQNQVELIQSARKETEHLKLYHCSDDVLWQNQIGRDLMEWAEKEDSRLLDDFPLSRRLAPQWFYRMALTNNYFAQCLQFAKAKLGTRMEHKVKNHPSYIAKALPMYSTLWIEAEDKKNAEESRFVHQYKEISIEIPVITTKKGETSE